MQLLHNDIIIRQYQGETLWLSQRLVMQVCGVTEDYLRQAARDRFKKSIQKGYKYGDFLPNTGAAWRWGKANGTFYYDFDCLPDRKPTYYRSKFGTKHELIQAYQTLQASQNSSKQNQLKVLIQTQVNTLIDNTDALHFMYKEAVGFNQKQANEMALAKAWCLFLHRQLQNDAFKEFGITKKQDFLQICTDIISEMDLEGFRINSAAYLRNRISAFPAAAPIEAQRQFFVSGKYGNDNAQVVGKYQLVDESTGELYEYDLHQALIYHLYMNPGGSTKEYIHTLWHRDYIDAISSFGLQPVAYRTFCHHLSRFNKAIQLSKARHGEDWYKKNVLTYVTNEKLKYAHSLFCADGSGTIQYKYRKADGKWSTMKLFVLFVTDVASRAIVGWSVSKEGMHAETFEMLQTATKMAVETGGFQTMFEFISDNAPAFTSGDSKAFLNMVYNKVRTIEVGNSQANPAELQFKLFKSSLKDIKNFLSSSWNSSIDGKANPDNLDIKELPVYADAVLQMHELVKRWNNTPLTDSVSPKERFAIKNPKCQPLEATVVRWLFGNHTQVDISYMRGFVNVYKSQGYQTEKFQFEIPQYGGLGTELIAKATGYTKGVKLKVVWTEQMADLYTLDGKYILSCPPALKGSQSHAEMTDAQNHAVGHNHNRKLKQMAIADKMEETLNEIISGLSYEHEIAYGGNKESYNEQRLHNENINLKKIAKERADRDFKNSKWQS